MSEAKPSEGWGRVLHFINLARWCAERASGGEGGQGLVEYALVTGGIVVLLVVGLFAFQEVVELVLGMVCPSVDTAAGIGATHGSCIQTGS